MWRRKFAGEHIIGVLKDAALRTLGVTWAAVPAITQLSPRSAPRWLPFGNQRHVHFAICPQRQCGFLRCLLRVETVVRGVTAS